MAPLVEGGRPIDGLEHKPGQGKGADRGLRRAFDTHGGSTYRLWMGRRRVTSKVSVRDRAVMPLPLATSRQHRGVDG